ncbi:hypothetical protein M441DRAFT_412564 [Trichoderma asperellum CBS 433.97]|uniref:Uncharacterized protein n=1 Tax=Trichoderma asperellum (strain ATCC 204424 / CBS 433.97 / NBRC 101777) TaxID=1042311 RepID=A0A2T3Z7P0_TRIA4|nr:hypothetical protein M441DRAFT_412564 [Trichoderma asperellum CBS 433.97]PTB40802.1 hypothetical protein M441DRAFT_412564 [Trichoderma asperellum CBS 433.97]
MGNRSGSWCAVGAPKQTTHSPHCELCLVYGDSFSFHFSIVFSSFFAIELRD